MSYTALYRKFRPRRFAEVKGQDAIVTTLRNQIRTGRTGHAYLFCGTRGTGKTSVAKIFAQALNCQSPEDGEPCGECASCRAVLTGASMDVVEMDAASNNKVDDARQLIDPPSGSRYRVFIIDEVHMLTTNAFNALLKTLEEPPAHAVFILATTEAHKIPVTVLSRCQRYDFHRLTVETIVERMKEALAGSDEQARIEERALRYIARLADGAMRDAWSLLDQCLAFHYGSELTYDQTLEVLGAVDTAVFGRLFSCLAEGDVIASIGVLEEVLLQGKDLSQFVVDFIWYLRNLMLIQASGEDSGAAVDVSSENFQRMEQESRLLDPDALLRLIRSFSQLSADIRYAPQKRVLVEMTIIRVCRPEMEPDRETQAYGERLRRLERRVEKLSADAASLPSPSSAAEAPAAPPAAGESGRREGEKTLARAVPEDLRRIVADWKGIRADLPQPEQTCLRGAKLSLGDQGQLLIVFEEGMKYDLFHESPDRLSRLEKALSARVGKEVKVEVRCAKNGREFEDGYPDLEKIIHMEIEYGDGQAGT